MAEVRITTSDAYIESQTTETRITSIDAYIESQTTEVRFTGAYLYVECEYPFEEERRVNPYILRRMRFGF
jgi:hypothetical protein